jgi:hypothetical protein
MSVVDQFQTSGRLTTLLHQQSPSGVCRKLVLEDQPAPERKLSVARVYYDALRIFAEQSTPRAVGKHDIDGDLRAFLYAHRSDCLSTDIVLHDGNVCSGDSCAAAKRVHLFDHLVGTTE